MTLYVNTVTGNPALDAEYVSHPVTEEEIVVFVSEPEGRLMWLPVRAFEDCYIKVRGTEPVKDTPEPEAACDCRYCEKKRELDEYNMLSEAVKRTFY